MIATDLPASLPRNCTFDADDWQLLARHWYPVALASDVDEGPVAAKLLDELLVVYRSNGQVVVANDLCPHRGVPLSKAKQAGDRLQCAYHGLQFGAEGHCMHVPSHPAMQIPARFHLKTYAAVERYGLVWACLRAAPGGGTAQSQVPDMPHWDEPDFQQIVCPTIDIFGFAGRQLEGFLDVAHFGFVHNATFGDPGNVVVPLYNPVTTPVGFEAEYRSSVGNYPLGAAGRGKEGFEWLRHFRAHLPFTATLEIHFPNHGRLVVMNAASPVSARVTRLFAPIARNFDKDLPVQDVYDFNRRVFEEDKAIVESQRPECLPLDPALEVHIPADRSSLAYRRGLKAMGLGRIFTA